MNSPQTAVKKLNTLIGNDGRVAFLSAIIFGLFAHMSIMVSDIPNHDGLASIYFDQNMITSGRWFLSIACGISSFYSIPWMIGILSLIYLAITAILLTKLLGMKNGVLISLASGMLVTFPAIASNFAYVFTMDGYMLGVLLAVLSVLLTERFKLGFFYGGICLALSMGIYQAYLPIAVILCIYKVAMTFGKKLKTGEKILMVLKYLYMGIIGVAGYYLTLQVLLKMQGKVLSTYQGIGNVSLQAGGILASVKAAYADFFVFSAKGNVLFSNPYALVACVVLSIAFIASIIFRLTREGWHKSFMTYVCIVVVIMLLPLATNLFMIISPDVTYHLLMRYQWVMYGIVALGFIDSTNMKYPSNSQNAVQWLAFLSAAVIVLSYSITDNIAYSNLSKKYEKTYSYCLRLADRIEQTEGYYEGIPIYMIGVVGDRNYPVTDITGDVTDHMVGIGGDYLLYTPENYENFYRHYMGISFNFLRPEAANFYDTEEYIKLDSFPGKNSTKVVDGILLVKTENMH